MRGFTVRFADVDQDFEYIKNDVEGLETNIPDSYGHAISDEGSLKIHDTVGAIWESA